MSLLETLNSDLIDALKKGDKVRAEVIRGLKSDIKYKEIDKREPLTEEDVSRCVGFCRQTSARFDRAVPAGWSGRSGGEGKRRT